MDQHLEARFTQAMLNIYKDALALGYKATYFLRMISDLGAVSTAQQLIHDAKFSSGFTQLWQLNRLDLTVEALVLKNEWATLFQEEDRRAAAAKLAKLNFVVA